MTLNERLLKKQYKEIWDEYCGFLDFTMPQYMDIQQRLLTEQLGFYSNCELGEHIMRGHKPSDIDNFRALVPLTTYEDYADILLPKAPELLPAKPVTWIETTWEGSKHPIKVAPYTDSMIKSHRRNFISSLILSTSNAKGSFSLRMHDRFLYGMAPLPYFTGMVPHVLEGELDVKFLPPHDQAIKMSFSQRNRAGFKLGFQNGIDVFSALSSVIVRMGEDFADTFESKKPANSASFNPFNASLKMNYRLLKALNERRISNDRIFPKDIWKLKGIICGGTDTGCFKKKIEEYWGVRPLEIFGGTEPSIMGTETWNKNGLVFFPDANFYEFIPYGDMEKSLTDPSFVPNTYLINEVIPDRTYELVITSLKGGAFSRYRAGDLFRCISLKNEVDGINLPQFEYIDRIPNVIDIVGFTRITQVTIENAIKLSKLDIDKWFAVKEFDEQNRPYMHMYVEVGAEGMYGASTKDIIKEHLSIYFRYVDSDYNALKYLLGIDPLSISIIPSGTIEKFNMITGRSIRFMNPSHFDVLEALKIAKAGGGCQS